MKNLNSAAVIVRIPSVFELSSSISWVLRTEKSIAIIVVKKKDQASQLLYDSGGWKTAGVIFWKPAYRLVTPFSNAIYPIHSLITMNWLVTTLIFCVYNRGRSPYFFKNVTQMQILKANWKYNWCQTKDFIIHRVYTKRHRRQVHHSIFQHAKICHNFRYHDSYLVVLVPS